MHLILGVTKLGLTKTCITFRGQAEVCDKPELPLEWGATLAFIVIGITLMSFAILLVLLSAWKETFVHGARWVAFIAGKLLIIRD